MGGDEDVSLLATRSSASESQSISEKLQGLWTYYSDFKNWNFLLLGISLSLIVVGTANRVSYKIMTNYMGNYPFFLNQLTSFIYLPVFWPVAWILMTFTDRITPDQRNFPTYKFVIMGLLDSIAGLLMMFGATGTSGPMQLLLNQGAIPMTMIFSVIVSLRSLDFIFQGILRVSYKWTHYLGALILIAGIVDSLIGQIFFPPPPNPNAPPQQTSIISMIIFFSNTIPTGFSGVYKEIGFKGTSLDVFYCNAWVATWQFLLGMLFLPVTTIPGFGGLSFDQIPGNLWGGALCLFGIDSITCDPGMENCTPDNCHGAYIHVGTYMFFNILYNIVILLMIKFGSASLLYVCSAVILPAADICYTQSWIMGLQATSLTVWDITGLLIILIGLFFYRLRPESDDDADAKSTSLMDTATSGGPGDDDLDEDDNVPIIMAGGQEVFHVAMRRVPSVSLDRSVTNVRHHYMSRLGIHELPQKLAPTSPTNETSDDA